ncbi:MAG: outer membrane beta-barrel protein [Clostridiales bacterium]|nr:outer membrane beta-barrel protein [Clostridiales bacterium]
MGYDDNIYGTYGNRPPVADYTASLSIPINVYLPFRDWLLLSFSDSPQYDYFFDLDKERAFNNSYSAGFRMLLLNRFVVSGAYGVSRTKFRQFMEIDRRIFQELRSSSGSIFLETVRGSSLGFTAAIRDYAYEDVTLEGSDVPLSRALDREEREGRIEFYYPVFTDSSFFMNFGYIEYRFINPEGTFRDSYAYQANAGIAFPMFGRARGTLSLGYRKLVPRDENLKGFSGPVGNTSVELRLGRFNLRARYIRDIPFSYGSSFFYVSNNYGAGLSFYLSSLIRLDYDFSYGGGRYPEATSITLPDGTREVVERNDIYRGHSASIVFRIIRNTGLGLSAVYSERNSSYDLWDSDRLSVGVFLTYDF